MLVRNSVNCMLAAVTLPSTSAASVRLMFDGERCEPDATPLDLDMEDGDQIVCE